MTVTIDYYNPVLDKYHTIFRTLFFECVPPEAFHDPLRELAEQLISQVPLLNPKHKPRQMLGFCDQYELFFLEREPYDNSLAPHDHGQAWGIACVMEGCLQETTYRMEQNHEGHGLIPQEQALYCPGDIVSLPKGLIHIDSNPTEKRTISLNLFVPCIRGMKVYKPEGCCVVKPGVRPLKEKQLFHEIERWE